MLFTVRLDPVSQPHAYKMNTGICGGKFEANRLVLSQQTASASHRKSYIFQCNVL